MADVAAYGSHRPNGYIFPTLKQTEILQCMTDLGIPFQEEDLSKPQPQRIQFVYEAFADILMGVTKDQFEQPNLALMEMLDYSEIHTDALSLITFHNTLLKLMSVVGVDDFSLRDVIKPEGAQVKRILSAIINFAKFREERMTVFEQYTQKIDEYLQRRDQLTFQNAELRERVAALKQQRLDEQPHIKAAQEANNVLTGDLRDLKKQQTTLAADIDVLKRERSEVTEQLSNNQFITVNTQQDISKIRNRIVHSPEKLKQAIQEMAASLAGEKTSAATLDKKLRELQSKLDNLVQIEMDVTSCVKLMEECEVETLKVDERRKTVKRTKDEIDRKDAEFRELEIREQQLHRQMTNAVEKLERVQQQSESKRVAAQEKMEKIRMEYSSISEERGDRLAEIEKKRAVIEALEMKIAEMKSVVEGQISEVQTEYSKLKREVESYMNTFGQSLNLKW